MSSDEAMISTQRLLIVLIAWIPSIAGFLIQSEIRTATTPSTVRRHYALPPIDTQVLFDHTEMIPSSTFVTASALDIVRNVIIGAVGIGVVLVGLAFIFSTWLIPQAAKQLEEQAKSVDPSLWREYEAKLESGETLAMRPELMQELGVKVRQKMAQQFDAALERQEQAKATSANESSGDDGIMDATILSKEDAKKD